MCIFIVGLSQAILSHFAGNGLRSSVVVAGNGRDRRSPVMVAVVVADHWSPIMAAILSFTGNGHGRHSSVVVAYLWLPDAVSDRGSLVIGPLDWPFLKLQNFDVEDKWKKFGNDFEIDYEVTFLFCNSF